jgi:hypothetical protein
MVSTYDSAGQGAFLALSGTHLVTYAECPGIPRAVLSTDLATGAVSTLVAEAFDVTVEPAPGGAAKLTIQTAAGSLELVQ